MFSITERTNKKNANGKNVLLQSGHRTQNEIINTVKILSNRNNINQCNDKNYRNKWLEHLERMHENQILKLLHQFQLKDR
jgi:hypothetical protein